MRIAIDAHMVGTRETGNETYVLNLIKALARIDTVNEYFILSPHPSSLPHDTLGQANFSPVRVFPSFSPIRIPLAMPYLCWRRGYDLLHVNYIAPPFSPIPTVVTIHDISYEFFPQFFGPRDRWLLSTLAPLSARRAARIIAPSENTRRDLVERYRLDRERIAVTHYASDSQFRPISDSEELLLVRDRYGINKEFILTVGNLQPRKNIRRLIEAMVQLRERHFMECQLVIVGQPSWPGEEVHRLLEDKGLQEQVVFTGYVPADDLPLLYNAAILFAYPSLYEGFGLPPLEAMACGTPVIASNTSSLPEVLGEGALLVDPCDVKALTRAIFDLLSEPGQRAALAARGLARSASFSWEVTARQTVRVYKEVIGGGKTKQIADGNREELL